MLPVKVKGTCEIIQGPLKGTKGIVVGFDYCENEVIIQLDDHTKIVTIHEYIKQ